MLPVRTDDDYRTLTTDAATTRHKLLAGKCPPYAAKPHAGGGNGGGPFGAAVGGAIGGDAGALTGGAVSGVLSSQGPTILPPNAPNPTPLGQLEKARQGLSRGLIGAGAGILATEATSGLLDAINNLCEETPCEQ